MDCWTLLQLPDDADERSIRRSYARLLKANRPDDDPEAFQRLREAYEEALEVVRWRDDFEAEEDWPQGLTVAAVEAPLAAPTQPLRAEPAPFDGIALATPAAATAPARPDYAALVAGLDAENLAQRWELARQQGHPDDFQQALLRLCFEQPGLRSPIADWATRTLDWLTPWQTVKISPEQQEALANDLQQHYRQALQEDLEAGQERAFVTALLDYSEQAWLKIFDRRLAWQRIVLELLHQTPWGPALFERVCQLFGWDERHGATPEPAWIWYELTRRCERESFFEDLKAKALNQYEGGPQQKAAYLLLTPLTPSQQAARLRYFAHSNWEACQALSQTLAHRHPQLIERLPDPDVFFWHTFLPRNVPEHAYRWLWGGSSLALLVSSVPLWPKWAAKGEMTVMLFLSLMTGLIPAIVGLYAMKFWVPAAWRIVALDLWLSARLIPERINPSRHWLIVRHGIPVACLSLLFLAWAGILGMLTYLGIGLIGLLDRQRQGAERPANPWRHPWQSLLHFSGWSPLQLGYLLLMLAVNLACVIFYNVEPLTMARQR